VESLGAISPGVGLLLGGAIAALSSPRSAFLVAGLGAALSTIAFARLPLGKLTGATPPPGPMGGEPGRTPDSPPSSMASAP
jgi:hypothetical protein